MRILSTVLLLACASFATGCDKLGLNPDDTPPSPGGPPAAGSTIVYSALGASDVIGFGSSRPCLPFEDCNGNGYVWVAMRQLRTQGFTLDLQQLGIPTGVISRTFQDLGAQYGRNDIFGNFLQQEVPFVRRDATVVTLFAGGNDVNVITNALGHGAGGSNPTAYIDQMVNVFRTDYGAVIAGIRARAPGARLVLLNLPNLAGTPYMSGASLAQKQAAQRAAVWITTTVVNTTANATVIDLMCDPRLYQANIFSADGFHPNDNGYAILGAEIVKAVTSTAYPAPKSSCPQMAQF